MKSEQNNKTNECFGGNMSGCIKDDVEYVPGSWKRERERGEERGRKGRWEREEGGMEKCQKEEGKEERRKVNKEEF